jgi:L-alanine-DL-glutamate epimerase-like enolase superfamily enzyme
MLLLALQGADGTTGFGEAAPLTGYDGASMDDVVAAIESCRRLLEDSDGADCDELLSACASVALLPQALAAIDLALWDLAGRRAGQPVWRLLGAADAPPVAVNWTVAATGRAGAAREASLAREAGFRCLKVKVGTGDDAGLLAAVRAAAGPEMAIRIDANGSWSHDAAIAALATLEPVGLELCEEPASGAAEVAQVAAGTGVPVAIDETATEPGALDWRLCAAACLKVSSSGGIAGLVSNAERARAAGYEIYLASTLDGPLGIAAALHAAAAVRPDRPCGLATLRLFERSGGGLAPQAGLMAVPAGPGLGDGLLDWYGPLAR